MLIIFTRAIIIYIFLLIAMRLMGKKQLGELQPFEFAISLIVADLASIPIGDASIPLSYGLVPIFTLYILHLIVNKIVKHNIRMRGIINGHPIIVINGDGIDYKMLKKLDMTISDLMEALRGAGYFSPSDVEYAIVETNGSLTVLPKSGATPLTRSDLNLIKRDNVDAKRVNLPITLISEGKRMSENMYLAGLDDSAINDILHRIHKRQKDILLLSICGNDLYIQPKLGKCIEMPYKVNVT